jgi:hypothetical protein
MAMMFITMCIDACYRPMVVHPGTAPVGNRGIGRVNLLPHECGVPYIRL